MQKKRDRARRVVYRTDTHRPQRECREPVHLDYKKLGGEAQTRRPLEAPKIVGGSVPPPPPPQPPLQLRATSPPSEEDSDPDQTIRNHENDEEWFPSSGEEVNQISVLMDFCQDEWGPWRLRPGPIHKGV